MTQGRFADKFKEDQELNPPTEADFAALRKLEKYLDQNLRDVNHPTLNALRKKLNVTLRVGAKVGGYFSPLPGTGTMAIKIIDKLNAWAKGKLQQGEVTSEAMPLLGGGVTATSTTSARTGESQNGYQGEIVASGMNLEFPPSLEDLIERFLAGLARERSDEAGERDSTLLDISDGERESDSESGTWEKLEDDDNPYGKT